GRNPRAIGRNPRAVQRADPVINIEDGWNYPEIRNPAALTVSGKDAIKALSDKTYSLAQHLQMIGMSEALSEHLFDVGHVLRLLAGLPPPWKDGVSEIGEETKRDHPLRGWLGKPEFWRELSARWR